MTVMAWFATWRCDKLMQDVKIRYSESTAPLTYDGNSVSAQIIQKHVNRATGN